MPPDARAGLDLARKYGRGRGEQPERPEGHDPGAPVQHRVALAARKAGRYRPTGRVTTGFQSRLPGPKFATR